MRGDVDIMVIKLKQRNTTLYDVIVVDATILIEKSEARRAYTSQQATSTPVYTCWASLDIVTELIEAANVTKTANNTTSHLHPRLSYKHEKEDGKWLTMCTI